DFFSGQPASDTSASVRSESETGFFMGESIARPARPSQAASPETPGRKGAIPEKMASSFLIKVDSRPEKSDSPDANYGRTAMRKTTCGALLLGILISACGGEGEAVPPPQAPPP